MPGIPSDDALADACRRGELPAFEKLYSVHASRMKSVAFHLLGNRPDAEDAVQEAFLKVHRGLNRFRGQSSLGTWIYRILINACYDLGRKRERRAEAPAMADAPASRPNLPLRLALQSALNRLNEQHRMVFLLFEVEGFKHSEIAAVLEIPEGTSRSWLFEAKLALKRSLMEPRHEI